MLEAQQQTKLTREQKEAVGLLSIGTFLEFFDFMLYVHMATYLNELFFPKSDPSTTRLLAAAAFCSSYVLRPIGALIFGYIGDNIGRKFTFIITTAMMAICCLIMANLPTYAEWGYTASVCMIACRIIQGLSSIGEIVGAEIYVTEITKPPIQYSAVAIVETMGLVGTTVALVVATLATADNMNWRIAFWFGTVIAVIGGTARRVLRETTEFADANLQLKRVIEATNIDPKKLKSNIIVNEKVKKKNVLFYFLMDCFWPLSFYFAYFYCGTILKDTFNFTTGQVIHQNLLLSIIQMIPWFLLAFLSSKIYPLKLLKIKLFIFMPFLIICPFLLNNATSPLDVLLIQSFIVIFSPTTIPAVPIFLKNLPLFKRFTYSGLIYAFSRASIFVICSFGLIYLIASFGHYGILFIMLPISIGYIFGLRHFSKLAREDTTYQQPSFSIPVVETA